MATILNFIPRKDAATRRRPDGAGPASIVFFTGVRYERRRTEEAAISGEAKGSAKPPRRRSARK